MPQLLVNLVGQRFGALQVLRQLPNRGTSRLWKCQCDCGSIIESLTSPLLKGRTTHCGCLRNMRISSSKRQHGHCPRSGSWSPEYKSWAGMLQRCRNPKDHAFKYYGGRGITVCDRWLKFENFLADMGPRPDGLSIDRINNDGNYEPGNCRWTTMSVQISNRRFLGRKEASRCA